MTLHSPYINKTVQGSISSIYIISMIDFELKGPIIISL